MALKKKIKADNGIVLEYHRIPAIRVDTNQTISITVASYLAEDGRQYEKDWAAGNIEGEPSFQYSTSETFFLDFKENKSLLEGNLITNAYNWLKTTEIFKDAEDV